MAELTTVEARVAEVTRASYGRLLALLAAPTRDIAAAEDALADALEQALRRWPDAGVPDNPEAWLLTVARNRERDRFRSAAHRTAAPLEDADHVGTTDDPDPDAIPDQRLALLFVCTHPAIDRTIRTPLMLQTVLGFDTEQIARAFAIPAPTMLQRLVRAKRRIRDAGIAFVVPDRALMTERMPAVLEAIYGTYAIDWQGVAGATERTSLSGEALYLAETLVELTGDDPEVLGLAALIALSSSRAAARVADDGAFVPLGEQDPAAWDDALIARGEAHLHRAHAQGRVGRYQLEAAIQSAHLARRTSGTTDWRALRTFHVALQDLAPSLGGAVALTAVVGETDGPAAGLALLDELEGPHVERFQPAWATRAHLAERAGDRAAGRAALDRAIALTTDPDTRAFLERRRSEM
ncbi:RNA polymerase sigma factor [Patulibacter minatonensis]|uniref:RNA polymerase sigma factor n=1 Tax=Patulibacter minatonensis TaxID=298163 RepID=UPI000478FA96|nr:DUF6596 domain-containing protein [Patulibacter minatonensis]